MVNIISDAKMAGTFRCIRSDAICTGCFKRCKICDKNIVSRSRIHPKLLRLSFQFDTSILIFHPESASARQDRLLFSQC